MRFLANLGKLALLILLLLVITGLVVRQTGNRSPNLDGQAKEVIVEGQQPAPVDSATYVTPDPTAAPSQEMEERPSPDFWPRQVRLLEPWVFEQKNNYGTVTASRPSAEVVRVVNVKSEKLEVENNGLSGTVETHKTDFWNRAKEAQRAAIEKAQQDKILEERLTGGASQDRTTSPLSQCTGSPFGDFTGARRRCAGKSVERGRPSCADYLRRIELQRLDRRTEHRCEGGAVGGLPLPNSARI
jgi:hypothetical protein